MFSFRYITTGVIIGFVFLPLIYIFSETKLIASVLLLMSLSVSYFFIRKHEKVSLQPLDITFLSIIGFEVISFLFSVNPLKSYVVLAFNLTAIALFYFVKQVFTNKKYMFFILRFGMVLILAMSIFSLYSFWLLRQTLHSVCWYSFYDFRHLYRPFGLISNVWYSFLLVFLSYSLIYFYQFSKDKLLCCVTLVSVVVNLMISFSRSVYLILVLIVVISVIQFIFYRKNGQILLCLIIPMLASYTLLKEDCNKTLSFNTSVSQQRSISARVSSTKEAIHILKNNYLGYGQGSYSLINSKRFEDVDIPFTSFAPNILAQFFVEKGVFGTILWSFFFLFSAIYLLINYWNKDKNCFFVILIFLISFALRELSFAVFQENIYYQFIFFGLLALLIQGYKSNINFRWIVPAKKLFICLFGLVILILSSNFFLYKKMNVEKYIHSAVYYWNMYEKSLDKKDINQANECFNKAKNINPYDNRLCFMYLLTEYERGNKAQSLDDLQQLINDFPKNALYQLTMFSLLNKEHNEKAFEFLINTIELSPKILDTEFFQSFLIENPSAEDRIKTLFFKKYANIPYKDPFELAKQGKILLFFGFKEEAQQKLQKVAELYPALSRVWFNLYLITKKELFFDRFILLEYGSYFVVNKDKYPVEFFIKKINIDFLQNSYIPKYQNWYMKNYTKLTINGL